ncbi:LemA family protein [Candidatus Woesebacteria bacterium]|nr:LemA family protein [Candidatus Woesebacteria bacterium]
MQFLPIILIAVLVGGVMYVVGIYNFLQRLKTQIAAAIQEIGNQLKRQASLIPNLEASVKGYLKHEKGIFQMLTDARTSAAHASETGSGKDINDAINKIQSIIPQIAVMVEDNPEIKGDATVTKFMAELSDTADKLMYARRTVIDLTQSYNEKLVVFPSNILAGMFGFTKEVGLSMPASGSHLSVSDDEMKDVTVNL